MNKDLNSLYQEIKNLSKKKQTSEVKDKIRKAKEMIEVIESEAEEYFSK